MLFVCKKRNIQTIKPILLVLLLVLCSGKSSIYLENWKWIQQCLLQSYNYVADSRLKKWELSVAPEGFFRLRKFHVSGKQEYFSFHFSRLKDVRYDGVADSGNIVFNTLADDIIVQTFNDAEGNVDSMSTVLKIPVINMRIQKLDSLRKALMMFQHR